MIRGTHYRMFVVYDNNIQCAQGVSFDLLMVQLCHDNNTSRARAVGPQYFNQGTDVVREQPVRCLEQVSIQHISAPVIAELKLLSRPYLQALLDEILW